MSGVSLVCSTHRCQVGLALAFEDHRRIAESHEDEVEDEPARAAVAVDERMDLLEELWSRAKASGRGTSAGTRRPGSASLTWSIQSCRRASRAQQPGVIPPANGRMSCRRNWLALRPRRRRDEE